MMKGNKPPPLLLGFALAFWGWQTGFLLVGLVMGLILEAARWSRVRWEFSDEDFSRIWTFCTLLFLATTVYAFTANEGPGQFRTLFENPNFLTQRNAGTATARTAASLFRWLPLVFFLFTAAQSYSSREGVPIETISLILSRRWKKAKKRGRVGLSGHTVNVAYYYFGICLFSASVHSAEESTTFFWGLAVLVAYALWWNRPRRFAVLAWVVCFGIALGLGYLGQRELSRVQSLLGNINPWWLAGLGHGRHDPTQSRTDLGRVGRMKNSGKIVIRVETPEGGGPPGLLREASYRKFKGQTWYAESNERDFTPINEDGLNSSAYQLIRGKTNTLRVQVGCYLDGGRALLPLPPGCARLEHLTAFTLAKNSFGAVLDDGPGVVVFDALYGPGATIDSSPEGDQDSIVPYIEQAALDKALAEAGLDPEQFANQSETSEPDITKVVRTLNNYFSEKFSYALYQPWLRFNRTNETALSRFLLKTHKGHCEYFATAGVLMLRRLNIPTRYAVGYAVHERSNGKYVVRQRDAHAWCLVWDKKHTTWRDVDFTPATWVQMEDAGYGKLQAFADFWSRVGFELSKVRWGQTHLRQYLLLAVIPVLGILLYQIIFHSRKRKGAKEKGSADAIVWPGLDSEFYRIEKALRQKGLERQASEPLSPWLERCSRQALNPQLRLLLQELLSIHYRYRFDPQGLSSEERDRFRTRATTCLEQINTA